MPKLRDLMRVTPRAPGPASNGHNHNHDHAPAMKNPVTFDAGDGRKRIVITVNTDGTFEPTYWFGMTELGGDQGRHEAAVIAAHGALIMAEECWKSAMGMDPMAVDDGS